MSADACTYPMIGKFVAVGIFLSDECGAPIVGADAGYVDWCPAALSMEDDVTEGDAFTRTCANGKVVADIPPEETLAGIDTNLDLHGIEFTFLAGAGGASPVTQGGEVVGWDTCRDGSGNASIFLWREIIGDEACDPEGAGGQQWLLTVLPWVSRVRLTEEGTFGSSDAYVRLTGRSRSGHAFGVGPLPVFPGADPDTDPPVKFDDPVDASCMRRTVITSQPPPAECGVLEVVA